jgi:hypothetical protein
MTSVQSISQTATDFKDKYMDSNAAQSGEEPVSGVQGKGTATDPYDAGNSTDPAPALSGEEPPSGIQGKGTATEPYDGGNAPGKYMNIPPCSARSIGTHRYDRKYTRRDLAIDWHAFTIDHCR